MRTVGIIAEYNPFHMGHRYHIAQAKKRTGADYCVIVLSGNFVQRGEPAVFEKSLRTEAALRCGADLVLELPVPFATGSAEDFASGAVALLSRLGTVDDLCFGSEWGNEELLKDIARLLVHEPEGFQTALLEEMKKGLTWPQARIAALSRLGHLTGEEAQILSLPNHILAVEYLKALLRQNSSIRPLAVKRRGRGYHDCRIDPAQEGEMASASGLRALLKEAGLQGGSKNPAAWGRSPSILEGLVPPQVLPLYQSQRPLFSEDFSPLLNQAMVSLMREARSFQGFEGITPDLSRRMERVLLNWEGWEGRIRQLKTRQFTYTRISRCLCHLLLGVAAADMKEYRKAGYALYGRVLGFRRQAAPLLKAIDANSSIPLIRKTAGCQKELSPLAARMMETDISASHLWHSVYWSKYGVSLKNEYNRGLVIL